jgi:hypothetical protein
MTILLSSSATVVFIFIPITNEAFVMPARPVIGIEYDGHYKRYYEHLWYNFVFVLLVQRCLGYRLHPPRGSLYPPTNLRAKAYRWILSIFSHLVCFQKSIHTLCRSIVHVNRLSRFSHRKPL